MAVILNLMASPTTLSLQKGSDLPAVQRFILDVLEPQKDQFNIWDTVLGWRGEIISDAKKRRKITPTKLAPRNSAPMYALTRSGTTIGGIDGPYTTLVSHQARRATQSRQTMRQYLQASNLPQHPSKTFHASQEASAAEFASAQAGPLTLRPGYRKTKLSAIQGVFGPEAFNEAWTSVADSMESLRPLDRQIEIETPRTGIVLRIYVVGERAIGSVVRTPFFVLGDGSSTVRQLIDSELQRHSACAYLHEYQPSAGSERFCHDELSLDDIPPEGSLHICSEEPDAYSPGVLSMDVLEAVHPSLLSLAVDAMWAFPGLSATGVDILTPSMDASDQAVIVDVDPGADIREFIYPSYGESRRIGLALLDNMISAAGSKVAA